MNLINEEVRGYLGNSSFIRKMFEAGIELRRQYGDDKVYDFSLGNPDLPPPKAVQEALSKIAARAGEPFSIGYMPNAGYPELREAIAERVSREQGVATPGANIVVTCGAAGAINVLFHTILSPGDEVITPAPYFVEYDFYAANHGGRLVRAASRDFSFELDIEALERAFSPRTRAVILNSPNNPTGQIYSREEITALAELVRSMEKKYDRAIYLVSDEPYRFLNFDGVEIPSVFAPFDHAVVIGSCSKNLSLAGERIGYIAVSPSVGDAGELMAGLILCNRILGFVNAPAIGQKLLLAAMDSQVDLNVYRERREAMARVLDAAGIEYTMPRGSFYFFPKSPVPDDKEFVNALLEERVLVVPGSGFGCAGYFRAAFCVDKAVIENAAAGFAAAAARYR